MGRVLIGRAGGAVAGVPFPPRRVAARGVVEPDQLASERGHGRPSEVREERRGTGLDEHARVVHPGRRVRCGHGNEGSRDQSEDEEGQDGEGCARHGA